MTLWWIALAGTVAGLLVGWLGAKSRAASKLGPLLAAQAVEAELRQRIGRLEERERELLRELQLEQDRRARAETEKSAAEQHLAEQRSQLQAALADMEKSFRALADEALKSNNQAFLDLAKNSLQVALAQMGQKEQAVDSLVRPLAEKLQNYEEHLRQMQQEWKQDQGSLQEHLRTLKEDQHHLAKVTAGLSTALRQPQVRGRWGEFTLRKVVELAGMSEYCDFTEQHSTATEEGRLRPDMIVHLPAQREIVVDAKVALDAYLSACEASEDKERERYFGDHARQMRAHMNKLSEKNYWSQFPQAPDFVVMFVPGEPFLARAAEIDLALIEDGFRNKVVVATPSTLISLLRSVAYGWRQELLAKNAQQISDLGKEMYERLAILAEHVNDLGVELRRANESYNRAVASLESRVLASARRFREWGAHSDKELKELKTVDTQPRLVSPEALRKPR